ncbi:hypothetical protein ACTQZ1_001080 [Proteus mirabilis]
MSDKQFIQQAISLATENVKVGGRHLLCNKTNKPSFNMVFTKSAGSKIEH